MTIIKTNHTTFKVTLTPLFREQCEGVAAYYHDTVAKRRKAVIVKKKDDGGGVEVTPDDGKATTNTSNASKKGTMQQGRQMGKIKVNLSKRAHKKMPPHPAQPQASTSKAQKMILCSKRPKTAISNGCEGHITTASGLCSALGVLRQSATRHS